MDKIKLQKEISNYKPEMTSDERLKAYFKGERVDHLPFNLMSLDMAYGMNLGYTLKETDQIENLIEIIKKRCQEYKVYGISEGLNLRAMGYALGSSGIFPENDIDHVEKYLLEDKIDMSLLEMPDPYKNKFLKRKIDNARRLKENFPDHKISTFVAGPMTVLSALRPIEKLLRDLRKNPQGVKELLDFCFEANMKWAKAFKKEFGPTSVMVVDPVGCDDILSPKQVEEFSLPYLKKQLSAYYELNGIKANLHICGHTKKQWKYFKDLDIDFFSVDNCEDLEECKKEIEDKLIVVGNIPPVEVMRYGSIDDVIKSVKTCIKKAADAKCGYIAATGCGSPVKTPIENLDAFIYAINKYGKNAKLGEMPEAINE